MSHEEISERIYAFADGELPEQERREVESHLAACRECAEVLDHWRRIAKAFLQVPEIPPSEAFVQRVMRGLPVASEETSPYLTFPWAAPILSLAAAALILILAWPERGGAVAAEALLVADAGEAQPLDDLLGYSPEEP